jgi:mono/diheme cytochrome c family protein
MGAMEKSEKSLAVVLAAVVAVLGVVALFTIMSMRRDLNALRAELDQASVAANRASTAASHASAAATQSLELATQAKAAADLAKGVADGAVVAARAAGATAATLAQQAPPATPAPDVSSRADPSEGKRLALKVCSGCHVVSAEQQMPPISEVPGPHFDTIANQPHASAESLRNALATSHAAITTPSSVPNPRLTNEQAANVVSYIMSLRQ